MNTYNPPQKTNIFLACLLFLIFLGCQKTTIIDPNLEPAIALETGTITIISPNQIKMTGEIKNINNEQILDIGFVLYDISQSPENPKEISLKNKEIKEGLFELTYTSPNIFEVNREYAYAPYIKTAKGYYKGELKHFSVDLIKINNDHISVVPAGKSFTLQGDFSQMSKDFYLTLTSQDYYNVPHTVTLPFEVAKDAKSIKITAPKLNVYHGKEYEILLNTQSKNGENHKSRFFSTLKILANIDTPKVNEIYITDDIPITGYALPIENNHDLKITIEGKTLPYTSGMKMTDFDLVKQAEYTWSYNNGLETIELPKKLQLKKPTPDQLKIDKYIVHPYQYFWIQEFDYYKFFGEKIAKIKIGNNEYNDVKVSNTGFFLEIGNLPLGEYDIIFSSALFDVKLPNKVKVVPFNVSSISKTEVYPYEPILFTGSFIKGDRYFLGTLDYLNSFGNEAISDKEVIINFENLPSGTYTVNFGASTLYGSEELIIPMKFKLLQPVITTLSKHIIKIGEILTLKGKGLNGVNYINLGDYSIFISKRSFDEIQIQIPYWMNPGKYPIKLIFDRTAESEISTSKTIEIL
ncbi:hypothetical protein [Sphingobacterium sp. 1.A.5]|uniref:hypothetical protein n=1 Tax=Sphingobacterium sp. 1.A.5 TaxID=2044604 RepID=UPI000C0BE20B|nr:hypothetical protein [Sphingobacterium sp. 1.A.5]